MAELKCTYDPLVELMSHYANSKSQAKAEHQELLTLEERLKRRIIDGDKIGIDGDLRRAIEGDSESGKKYTPLQIINEILLDGMRIVGELFGSGQMQLPFVLQSAETMKTAVNFLESFMERVEGMQKGTIVLATVKGDVHDIGKNLVDIILTNNGYRVVNLGIKVPVEKIIEAAETQGADAIGMSGLLVKSTVIMKENLELMEQRGIKIPVVLGGAALTRRYVEQDLRRVYGGYVSYANDAFEGLHFMSRIHDPTFVQSSHIGVKGNLREGDAKPMPNLPPSAFSGKSFEDKGASGKPAASRDSVMEMKSSKGRVRSDVQVPLPPFYGSELVRNIKLEKVWEYLNEAALFRGQWQFSKKGRTEEEYKKLLVSEIYPALEEQKLIVKREKLFEPRVIYGYFPCQSSGNDLIIYRPVEELEIYSRWKFKPGETKNLIEWVRFSFPRQVDDRFLCISDYFKSAESGIFDVIAVQAVTIGAKASEHTRYLFDSGSYQNYLYLHGLSVESAEALAEYWHKIVRTELNIEANDAKELKRLLSQGYQGSRYSFGYPACPNLEDQSKLFTLLDPGRIGVTLTEEYQLVPEQSTTAIIVHHPDAKYFNIK